MYEINLFERTTNDNEIMYCDEYTLNRKGLFINLFNKKGNKKVLSDTIQLLPDYKRIVVTKIEVNKVEVVEKMDL